MDTNDENMRKNRREEQRRQKYVRFLTVVAGYRIKDNKSNEDV
jgi:hypothetical protein